MSKPVKRKVRGGRITPKGTGGTAGAARSTRSDAPAPSSRYTPPVPREMKISPRWVPFLMFTLLGLGMAIIVLNYVNVVPGVGPLPDETSNVYLLIGLGLILAGIVTATQYH